MTRFHTMTLAAFLALTGTSQSLLAQPAERCDEALDVAETAYFNGEFDRTIELLAPCIERNAFEPGAAHRAFTLFGRTQFVLGDLDAAREAIERLFTLDPAYEPDPQFPPNYIAFIKGIKQDMLAAGAFDDDEPALEETETAPDLPPVAETEDPESNADGARRRRLLLFGGGAAVAVAGLTAVLLSGGSSDDTPPPAGWPLPPGRP